MNLFSIAGAADAARHAPLAARMRPRDLDELVGQEHITGPGTLLRRAIEADKLISVILWGPPGSGKTTLARIVAKRTRAHFEQINAVTSGVQDLRKLIDQTRDRRDMHGQRTIVFIDEIHRFNSFQQDVLLPAVEDGLVTLIGATTENPFLKSTPRCFLVTCLPIACFEHRRHEAPATAGPGGSRTGLRRAARTSRR